MILVKSRYVIRLHDAQCPKLIYSPLRRGLYIGIGVLLGISMAVGLPATPDPFGEYLYGTLFIILLIVLSFGIGAYSRTWLFDKHSGTVVITHTLAGIVFRKGKFPLDSLREVSVQSARMLPDSAVPDRGRAKIRLSYAEKRKFYYSLILDIDGKRVKVDDGTDGAHMQQLGEVLSHALGVPFRVREI